MFKNNFCILFEFVKHDIHVMQQKNILIPINNRSFQVVSCKFLISIILEVCSI